MNRETIKEMRFSCESNGYFVEQVKEDCIIVTDLSEPSYTLYTMYPECRCPSCGAYLLSEKGAERDLKCIKCEYAMMTTEYFTMTDLVNEVIADERKEKITIKLNFNKDDEVNQGALIESFIEDIYKLYNYYYDELFDMALLLDKKADSEA